MYGDITSSFIQSTNKTYPQSSNASSLLQSNQYSALLINMQPATQYWYMVVASANRINVSSIMQTLYTRVAGMS